MDPVGLGGVLYVATTAVLVVIFAVGPLLLGARPLRIWILVTLAGVMLLLSLLGYLVTWHIGPLKLFDLTYYCAYALFLAWLTLLSRHVGGDRLSVMDSLTAAVGVSLALWSVALAPLAGGSGLPSGLVFAVYPTVDVALLALAVHIAFRLEVVVPAAKWLIASIVLQLLLDSAFAATGVLWPQANPHDVAPVYAWYLFWLYALAMAATHPSVSQLSGRASSRRAGRRTGRVMALTLLAASPAIPSTAIPTTGTTDTVVRTTLVAALLVLLIARLWRTLTALSGAEADSHHRATHDELTGLLNRAALVETLEVLDRNAREQQSTAVLFFDCDDFKYVNDTWGHHAGDTLLRDIAARLPERLGPTHVLGRQGGDEFVVLAAVRDSSEAVALAHAVEAFFGEPLRILPGRVHTVTSSIGVAVVGPGRATTTEDLLGKAGLAMYEAEAEARNRCVVFDEDLAQRSRIRSAVGDRLEEAVRLDVFGLQLQPVMGGERYETIIGWEALARWRDEDLGNVPPGVFVPLAEQLGLIADLGEAVLRRACRDLARLRRSSGNENLAVFVNVSPAQLLRADFTDVARGALAEADLPGRCLRLEVTETLLVDKGPAVWGTLHELRELGVQICLDDFGTGYASLATLLRLPIDYVKLDKSLIARLGADPEASGQVRAVIDLIASLGIEQVIAEGVETTQQERALAELGCPMVQGWLYGRPATTETVLATLPPGSDAATVAASQPAEGAGSAQSRT